MEGRVALRAPDNDRIADALERVADLLEVQHANVYRVRAYRNGARSIRETLRCMAELDAEGGVEALAELPGIGKSLASHVHELVHSGGLAMLRRLEGEVSPEDLFTTIPGIGERGAARIHRELDIETLEELELAAHDGRLAALHGFGERRVRGLRHALAQILSRSARRRSRRLTGRDERGSDVGPREPPPVATLLEVDGEYRERAERGELRTIAPRRFNPEGEAWLPVYHVEKEGWHFTALFSNTARAHELGTTRDWVVIYYDRDGDEDQCTIVTERAGPLVGHRVVRGRESDSAHHHKSS
ncbi:MAG: DNA-binding protein [Deltaproteobacteria bacterium]|nr:DNA-binding protein [Deltaproteobacteria bacterium]MBW2419853.1 DNA-binding protein [Deltaproteobacteria bacterium]